MAKKRVVYSGHKRKLVALLSAFILLGLALSIERTVIDVLGEMWGAMIINCAAIVCSTAGLLALCSKDVFVLAMYSVWNVLSIGLNVLLILIYHNIGLMAKKEQYLGLLVGKGNYWKGQGMRCMFGDTTNSTFAAYDDYTDDFLLNDELGELDQDNCFITYAIIETVHAAIYMFIAFMSFLLCSCLVLYPRKDEITDFMNSEEEFSYVNVAQHYDYPVRPQNHRRSFLGF